MTDYNKIEQVKQIIENLIKSAGFEAKVDFEESITKGLVFNIFSPESRMLIGRQGGTLHAIQILAQNISAKQLPSENPYWFTLDVDDYKRKREWFLKETARGAVEHLKKTSKPVRLEIMPNFERRFIHAYLQENCPDVVSESQGEDPYRRIVIRYK
jgi:spoIIIJ-associated protein